MAENQSKHRQRIESTVIESNTKNEKRGMDYAFILTLSLMGIGAILIVLDKQTAGYLSLFGSSSFIGGNYIYNKVQGRKDLKQQNERQKPKPRKLKSSK